MLVGLTGHSGSRKTRVAKRLQKAHGFSRMHAGRPVKRAMRAGLNLTKEQTSGALRDTGTMLLGGASPRDGMEATGDGWHKTMPYATTTNMVRRINKRMSKGKAVVVDGVRSPVEANAIRRMGGVIVRCDNGRSADTTKPMDMMQMGIDKVDYTVDTSGKKKDTWDKTDAMVSDFGRCETDAGRMGLTPGTVRTY